MSTEGVAPAPEVPLGDVSIGAAAVGGGTEGRGSVNNALGLGSDARPKMACYQGKRCENVNEWR